MSNNKAIYSLLESSLYHGGIKVKMDDKTCAQFPKLELAISYCQKILAKDKKFYQTIDFIKNDNSVEKIKLFD